MRKILILVTVWGFVLCPCVEAKDASEMQSIREEMEALRSELSSIRQGLEALRADMKKVLTELKGIRAAQAKSKRKRQPDTNIYDVTIGSSPTLGPKDAPVTIVAFGDFQCPYYVREYPKIKRILNQYPDKVRLVFKHFPLTFHKKARPAHAAAEFAHRTARPQIFWKMHGMIIAAPAKLDAADLRGYAGSLGLNLAKFDELLADPNKIDELLKADMAEARKCRVRGTPTVLINGLKLTDRSINGYKARIDHLLAGCEGKKQPCVRPKKAD